MPFLSPNDTKYLFVYKRRQSKVFSLIAMINLDHIRSTAKE